jgi:four helix bundle protein
MPGVRRFEDLKCWQEARVIALEVHQLTIGPVLRRDWVLTGQLRRAAYSVMSNIAEGFDQFTAPSFHRYLAIARGSCSEVRSLLYGITDAYPETGDRIGQLIQRVKGLSVGIRVLMAHSRKTGRLE